MVCSMTHVAGSLQSQGLRQRTKHQRTLRRRVLSAVVEGTRDSHAHWDGTYIPNGTSGRITTDTSSAAQATRSFAKAVSQRTGVAPDLIVQYSEGLSHAVALRADGNVVCLGKNSHGEAPNEVIEGPFVAVSAGLNYSLALRNNGSVACWGRNSHGQAPPEGVPGPFVAIAAAGSCYSVGVSADGTIKCWGENPWLAHGFEPFDLDDTAGWTNAENATLKRCTETEDLGKAT